MRNRTHGHPPPILASRARRAVESWPSEGETFEPVLTSCGSNLVSIALPTPVPRPMMLWPPHRNAHIVLVHLDHSWLGRADSGSARVRRCRGHCRSAWQAASTVLTGSVTIVFQPRARVGLSNRV